MSQPAPMQAPARAWGPSWDGALAWVAFAEYALYSQEWLRAALTHWELTKWLVPLPRLFFLFFFLLCSSPLLFPCLLFFPFTSFSSSSFLNLPSSTFFFPLFSASSSPFFKSFYCLHFVICDVTQETQV